MNQLNLASIPTPRVLIDRSRLKQNIAAMQARARDAGVRLRPHAKTHKSPDIARWQIEAGAIGICCAKLGEAEVFAERRHQGHPAALPRASRPTPRVSSRWRSA